MAPDLRMQIETRENGGRFPFLSCPKRSSPPVAYVCAIPQCIDPLLLPPVNRVLANRVSGRGLPLYYEEVSPAVGVEHRACKTKNKRLASRACSAPSALSPLCSQRVPVGLLSSTVCRYHTHVLRGQNDGQWSFHTMKEFLDKHYSPAMGTN